MNIVSLLVVRSRKNDEKSCEFTHAWKLVDIIDFEIKLIFPVSKGNKSPHEKVMIKLETKNNI